MAEHHQPARPTDLSGYLEAMARVIFSSGMSWRVVDAKWPGTREAFDRFDPERVASMGPADIDRLMTDTRVIRNRRKLEALPGNARRMMELAAEHGGFDHYLDSLGDFDATRSELKKQFAFLGDTSASIFLWSIGRETPEHGRPWQGEHETI